MTYLPDTAATGAEFCRLVRSGGVILFTQREDLWDERDCDDVLRRFEAQGRCRIDDISPPLPYLPGNDGLADIGAIVVQLRSGMIHHITQVAAVFFVVEIHGRV